MDLRKKLLTVAALAVFLACGALAPSVSAQSSEYKLQSTDILTITVHGHEDLLTKTRVSTDGYVTFPLVGKVYARGLTVGQLEERLKTLLEKDYLVSAPVVVFIETYHLRQVSVLGEVNTPGKFDMPEERDMTLLDAIAMAEGFTKDALITKVKIIRKAEDGTEEIMIVNVKEITKANRRARRSRRDKEEGEEEDIQPDRNIVLEPDDIVVVPESFF